LSEEHKGLDVRMYSRYGNSCAAMGLQYMW